MKRAMIYLIAVSALLTTLLAGCGDTVGRNPTTTPTDNPKVTANPDIQMPDVDDGVVGDTDGVISNGDTGGSTNVMDVPNGQGTTGGNSGAAGTAGAGAKTGRP